MFKSLEETGLKGFLEASDSVYEGAVIEFFANAKVIAGTIVIFVANRKMVLTKDVFTEAFGLPTEGIDKFSGYSKGYYGWMQRRFSGSDEPFKAPNKKKEMKMEFRLLHDIIAKALCAKAGSFDMVTSEKFDLMVAISAGVKVNWAQFLFQVPLGMVNNPKRQSQGFAVHVSVLLEKLGGQKKRGDTKRKQVVESSGSESTISLSIKDCSKKQRTQKRKKQKQLSGDKIDSQPGPIPDAPVGGERISGDEHNVVGPGGQERMDFEQDEQMGDDEHDVDRHEKNPGCVTQTDHGGPDELAFTTAQDEQEKFTGGCPKGEITEIVEWVDKRDRIGQDENGSQIEKEADTNDRVLVVRYGFESPAHQPITYTVQGIFEPIQIREINWSMYFLPKIAPEAKGKGTLEVVTRPNPVEEHCQLVLNSAWEAVSNTLADFEWIRFRTAVKLWDISSFEDLTRIEDKFLVLAETKEVSDLLQHRSLLMYKLYEAERMGRAELLRAMQEEARASREVGPPKKATKKSKAPSSTETEVHRERQKKSASSLERSRAQIPPTATPEETTDPTPVVTIPEASSSRRRSGRPPLFDPSKDSLVASPMAVVATRYICNMAPDPDLQVLMKADDAEVIGHFSAHIAPVCSPFPGPLPSPLMLTLLVLTPRPCVGSSTLMYANQRRD
ncbi:hypothetical protein F511_11129 [Dorcoceras hygrometricum]|uniref:Uncharacterized protein n=1 Tax=Dorcoceras hygrometricum TaxID=472368 RepID=A0A2Z7A3V0_9LAMI|nr:hypothetical protein F511_11129 [Dorcoceras hygrometricum]